jgi:hypothetical protein
MPDGLRTGWIKSDVIEAYLTGRDPEDVAPQVFPSANTLGEIPEDEKFISEALMELLVGSLPCQCFCGNAGNPLETDE